MTYSLTMTANPTAGTFPDFLRERYGAHWVLAQRMTDRLRREGHERNITQKQYSEAEREWETLAYGAPLKTLEAAAPAMLTALRAVLPYAESRLEDMEEHAREVADEPLLGPQADECVREARSAFEAARAAITAAEGRS